jgi:hypothetical protein
MTHNTHKYRNLIQTKENKQSNNSGLVQLITFALNRLKIVSSSKPYTHTFLSIFLSFFLTVTISAQNQSRPQPYGSWLMYTGDNPINEKFGIHNEAQLRNLGITNTLEQYLVRPGINFYVSPSAMVSTGYGLIYTRPSNNNVLGTRVLEHRIWEQLILRYRTRNVFIEHRYRVEQRFLENLDTQFKGVDNRVRYRIQVTFPLYSLSSKLNHIFFNSYNELFMNLGRKISGDYFDRNRFYLALGYQFNPKINIQLGYLNQIISVQNVGAPDVNHNLQLGLLYNLDIFKVNVKD